MKDVSLKVALLPGDGIGPEVTEEAVRILKNVAEHSGRTFSFPGADGNRRNTSRSALMPNGATSSYPGAATLFPTYLRPPSVLS